MKAAAIILIVLVLAAVCGVGYLYFSSGVEVAYVSCIATDPLNQAEYFSSMKKSLENGSFVGIRYSAAELPAPENCLFYTWTVRLNNKSFLPVNTAEIQVTPMSGDILLIGDLEEHTLQPRGAAEISATMLTARDMHSVREAIVTWYVWGLPFSTRLTLGK